MWEQMERDLAELKARKPELPPNAFTIHQFCEKFSLTLEQSRRRIHALLAEGRIEKVGNGGRLCYYLYKK